MSRESRILQAKIGDFILITKDAFIGGNTYLSKSKKYEIQRIQVDNDKNILIDIIDDENDNITIWHRVDKKLCVHTQNNFDIVFKSNFNVTYSNNLFTLVLVFLYTIINVSIPLIPIHLKQY